VPSPQPKVVSPAVAPAPEQVSQPAPKPLPKVSFKHFGAGKKEEEAAPKPTAPSLEEMGKTPINAEKLTEAWFAYIGTLPHDSVALAQRLKGLQPTVKDDNTAVLTVSNQQVQNTVDGMMPQILSTMRQALRNSEFRLETKLEEIQEVVKSYSAPELLKMMQEQNADVGELVSKLQLTFD
jgi:hypothetical protein